MFPAISSSQANSQPKSSAKKFSALRFLNYECLMPSNPVYTVKSDRNMLPHPHPIHNNMAPCYLAGNNYTSPIPTTTGKLPKPKNQRSAKPKMGWKNFSNTHPHKTKIRKQQLTVNMALNLTKSWWFSPKY